jgi:hypothetical protein
MRVTVEAQNDFLEKLAGRGRPALALAELIWNGLDADATKVDVEVENSLLGVPQKIVVSDNGHGFSYDDGQAAFGHLGGSWKQHREHTREQRRMLHGKDGKGRFRAFGLGANVSWSSVSESMGKRQRVIVRGSADDRKHFDVGEPSSVDLGRGTVVEVTDIWPDTPDLSSESIREELAEVFALYLRKYPGVRIAYMGRAIDPSFLEDQVTTVQLPPVTIDEQVVSDAELTIVEWTEPTSRSVYLCDKDGFTLSRVAPYIHAPGFHFTAYLKSQFFRTIAETLSLGEAHPGLQAVLDSAKEVMRDHFRQRSALRVREQVASWKTSNVYPYEGEAKTPVEEAERQVFDVVAVNVASYLPSFTQADRQNQQLSFRLLKQAIEENPESLRRILNDVLQLPKERQDDLAQLLERTSLSAVITAAKQVTDRLDFLRGLELLVFRPETKKQLLERSQLHRILVSETWMFDEHFHLTVDDQSLTEVLNQHLASLRRESDDTLKDNTPVDELPEVLREDGSRGIVDLMLSRRAQSRPENREHLVVELKRPAQAINPAVAQQIRSYAFAVQKDERFARTDTKWVFWALSNRVTEQVVWEMEDPERGVLKSDPKNGITIVIKTWGELIDECRARLTFFQERLQYMPKDKDAVRHLRALYEKYIPPVGVFANNAAEESTVLRSASDN